MSYLNSTFSRKTLKEYLSQLCQELGSAPVPIDEDNEAHIAGSFEEQAVNISIVFREKIQVLMMRSPVAVLSDPTLATAAQSLILGLNLSPEDIQGSAFGLSPSDGSVYLISSLLGPQIHFESFRVCFLRLFGLSAVWQKQLASSPAFDPYIVT